MNKTINTITRARYNNTLARALKTVAARQGSRKVLNGRLPVFIALQRRAAECGIKVALPGNVTEARKILTSLASL